MTIMNSRHCAYGYDQRLDVLGSLGMLQAGNQVTTTVSLSSAAGTRQRDPLVNSVLDRYAEAFRCQLDAFARGVTQGEAASPGYLDDRYALELACAAEASAKGHTVIRLN